MKTFLILLLTWTAATGFGASFPFYDVRHYGAAGNGRKLDTAAIQKAIDACAAKGGGKVVVPAGRYLTGALFLKSHIQIEIEAGAVLLGSTNFDDYPLIQGRWEGIERGMHASMFTGRDLDQVSITGAGVIDGQGAVWWAANRKTGEMRRLAGLVGREPENPVDTPMRWPRARMIYLQSCTNVLLRDITIQNSPSWNVHPVYCEHMTLDNLRILAPSNSPNTDAVDPDSCRDLHISNCYFSVGDDDIVLKSGYNEDGRRVGIPCENIVIENCTFGTGHGGVAIGSEMSGSVRNVTVANCVFDGTQRGIRVKTALGRGGVVENFRVSNLVMRNISIAAFSVTSTYDGPSGSKTGRPAPESIPAMRHFHWSEVIVVSARKVAEFNGLAESPLEDVSLSNVQVASSQSGIHCEYVKGLRLENIELQTAAGSAVEGHDVSGLEVSRLAVPGTNPGSPVVALTNASGVLLRDCRLPAGDGLFLRTVGGEPQTVLCEGNRLGAGIKERE